MSSDFRQHQSIYPAISKKAQLFSSLGSVFAPSDFTRNSEGNLLLKQLQAYTAVNGFMSPIKSSAVP